jgi:hypothetical protein
MRSASGVSPDQHPPLRVLTERRAFAIATVLDATGHPRETPSGAAAENRPRDAIG